MFRVWGSGFEFGADAAQLAENGKKAHSKKVHEPSKPLCLGFLGFLGFRV